MASGSENSSNTARYALALSAVAFAFMVRAVVNADVVRVPPLSFFAAVACAAWFGGYGPALLAALASTVILAVREHLPFSGPTVAGVLLLFGSGVGLAWAAAAMRRAREHADASTAAALRRQEELERQNGERERAERALHDQYLLTQAITDNATAALCMTDAQGRCTYVNPAAEELLGASFVQLRGRVLHDVLHEAHPGDGEATCPLSAGAPGRTLRAHVDEVRRADNSVLPVLCAVTPILRAGEPVGSVLELRDISVERRAARDRDALLQVTEQARLNAEAASRAKDEFLAVLSHELRSPLQAMVGWLAALRLHGGDPTMVQRAADALDRSLRVQGGLVNDLLDVSRIISGKLTLQHTWVDLALVAAASVEAARPAAEQKGLALQLTTPNEAVPLLGDPARLEQMIANLVLNAIKFTPRGGHVRVEVRRNGTQAVVDVDDDGEGISADVLPHIFERFRQADSQSTRVHGGLGLGLAIVRHLAEAHGGAAHASSAGAGRGASFRIVLPLAAGAAPSGEATSSRPATTLDGVRILLVDDDRESAEPLALALGHHGAEVAYATSVAEALARLDRERFDIVVSDLGMPGESGLSLARTLRVREQAGAARLPAIALTGFASREDQAAALEAGFDDHLAKPVDLAVLADCVGRLARS
ncbi:MAG: ATP-binding protein [Deltaproteobacteria bacterium]|nr:ATP-binding protein [Deltaproteobacteria bacterium]